MIPVFIEKEILRNQIEKVILNPYGSSKGSSFHDKVLADELISTGPSWLKYFKKERVR